MVLQDLSDKTDPQKGSPGLSAEQVLRCAVLKTWQQLSYQKLAFHLADSISLRGFCRLPWGWTPCKSCLQDNISRNAPQKWKPPCLPPAPSRPARPGARFAPSPCALTPSNDATCRQSPSWGYLSTARHFAGHSSIVSCLASHLEQILVQGLLAVLASSVANIRAAAFGPSAVIAVDHWVVLFEFPQQAVSLRIESYSNCESVG